MLFYEIVGGLVILGLLYLGVKKVVDFIESKKGSK